MTSGLDYSALAGGLQETIVTPRPGGASVTSLAGGFAPVISDPIPGDGLKLWTFTDQPPAGVNARRCLRAKFTLAP